MQHFRQHGAVQADFFRLHPVNGVGADQTDEAQHRADRLRDHRRQRRTVHAHVEHGHEQKVQHHVGDGGNNEVIQRMPAVAHGLQNAGGGVVQGNEHHAGEIDAEVQRRIGKDAVRRADPPKQGGGHGHAHHGQHHARQQAEGHGGVDGGVHLLMLLRAEVAGNDHARAGEQAAEQAHQQENDMAGGTYRGQRVAAQKVAHDQRVHNVIKLLKQVSPKNRKGETHDLPADGAAGHERYALRMFLIIFPGVHRR